MKFKSIYILWRGGEIGENYGDVEAIDMTSACGNSADLILTSKEIGEEIEGQVSGKLVYISNFMDKEEVKEKILKAIRN